MMIICLMWSRTSNYFRRRMYHRKYRWLYRFDYRETQTKIRCIKIGGIPIFFKKKHGTNRFVHWLPEIRTTYRTDSGELKFHGYRKPDFDDCWMECGEEQATTKMRRRRLRFWKSDWMKTQISLIPCVVVRLLKEGVWSKTAVPISCSR